MDYGSFKNQLLPTTWQSSSNSSLLNILLEKFCAQRYNFFMYHFFLWGAVSDKNAPISAPQSIVYDTTFLSTLSAVTVYEEGNPYEYLV